MVIKESIHCKNEGTEELLAFQAEQSRKNLRAFMNEALIIAESSPSWDLNSRLSGCVSMRARYSLELIDVQYGVKPEELHHDIASLAKGRTQISFKIIDLISEIKQKA